MANLGDTFLLAERKINSHFYIIISDPNQNSEQVVLVNFTSWGPQKDQSCIVEVAAHPYVTRRSCVRYGNEHFKLAQYEQFLNSGRLLRQDPVNSDLLRRILVGAAVSPFLSLGNRQILVEQRLIDNE